MLVASARSTGLALGYSLWGTLAGRRHDLATRRRQDFGASSADSRIIVKESATPANDSSETSRRFSAVRQRLDVRPTTTNGRASGLRFDTLNAVTAPARPGRAGRARPAK